MYRRSARFPYRDTPDEHRGSRVHTETPVQAEVRYLIDELFREELRYWDRLRTDERREMIREKGGRV